MARLDHDVWSTSPLGVRGPLGWATAAHTAIVSPLYYMPLEDGDRVFPQWVEDVVLHSYRQRVLTLRDLGEIQLAPRVRAAMPRSGERDGFAHVIQAATALDPCVVTAVTPWSSRDVGVGEMRFGWQASANSVAPGRQPKLILWAANLALVAHEATKRGYVGLIARFVDEARLETVMAVSARFRPIQDCAEEMA